MFAINLLLLSFLWMCEVGSGAVPVNINTKQYLHQSREEFLSIDLDCSLIENKWETFDPENEGVVVMAKSLSPAILRLGGTACDWVIFNDTFAGAQAIPPTNPNLDYKETSILKSSDWDKLMQLTRAANMTLLFDANVMLRDKSDKWDPTNFRSFLEYNVKMDYANMMFELGNEPNNYPAHFNKTITGAQLAADFATLRGVVKSYPLFQDSLIVGADVGNPYLHDGLQLDPATYIHDFFKAGHDYIDALTWHQYYFAGATAKVDDFINATIMNTFQEQVIIVEEIIESVLGFGRAFPVWMGETSSAYNSGAPNISNTYVAGFLWMDKLGVSARSGYDVVIRQTFYGGSYSLIDNKLLPYPDYWLSLLYKQLVGTRTLSITVNATLTSLRVYASCTNTKYGAEAGDITVYAMNLDKTSSAIISPNISFSSVLSYNMEPTDGTLTSPLVNINGNTAKLINNKLPKILPRVTSYISLKPLTFGLFVLTGANASACL